MGKRRALLGVVLLSLAVLTGYSIYSPAKAYLDRWAVERQLARKIERLKQETPLTEIDRHEMIGPPYSPFVFYGRDKERRPLAAWISFSGETVYGYHYLDRGITHEQAVIKAQEAGYQVDWGPVLVGPDRPFWSIQAHKEPGSVYFLRVDQTTGELTVKKNGE